MADAAAIGFQLRFAGTARADAAAQARQRVRRSDQPRHQVLQLRELHLELAFARARAPREDVENELRAIDDLPVERLLEVAELRGRQLVVEDHDAGVELVAGGGQRRRPCRCRGRSRDRAGRAPACTRSTTVAPAADGKAGELVERMFGIELTGRAVEEPDERRTLVLIACVVGSRSRMTHHCSDFSTRSHAIAPARTRTGPSSPTRNDRRRRAAGACAAVDQQSTSPSSCRDAIG